MPPGLTISAPLGLSPRVRGNRHGIDQRQQGAGTIPACAGEPEPGFPETAPRRDYPRVCGGTCVTRGNHPLPAARNPRAGTIPACAGEPRLRSLWQFPRWDYPRVCGGTGVAANMRGEAMGLSPRVRGNLSDQHHVFPEAGTIPACAGEPRKGWPEDQERWDYPRVCGGTQSPAARGASTRGLSPRVRGNRGATFCRSRQAWTIPACAGEPDLPRPAKIHMRDYPRVCGGTATLSNDNGRKRGLSPRVRGNPVGLDELGAGEGTIPACAGEPIDQNAVNRDDGDYPRVCGGTDRKGKNTPAIWGLSPRVRGNRPARSLSRRPGGTIPACAGEPSRRNRRTW